METNRNLANVGRKVNVSGQNLQHFVSNSPWSARSLIEVIQDNIKVHPAFQQAILVLDESAEEKSGTESAGAGRQHNGRLGKIEMSQVGVFLSLVTPFVNTWIDGELFIPARWFEEGQEQKRSKAHAPEASPFKQWSWMSCMDAKQTFGNRWTKRRLSIMAMYQLAPKCSFPNQKWCIR